MKRKVAVLLPDWLEYSQSLLLGIRACLARRRDLTCEHFRQLGNLGAPAQLFDWKPDGLIVYMDSNDVELLRVIKAMRVPTVNTASNLNDDVIPSIYVNPDSVFETAIQHLSAMGFPHMAFVESRFSPGADHRLTLWRATLARQKPRKKSFEVCLNYYLQPDVAESDPELVSILRDAPKPLGVFCRNDHLAEHVLQTVRKLKLKVPDEIGILGVGDSRRCAKVSPPLSSIRIPADKVCRQAVDLLLGMMSGATRPPRPLLIPCQSVHIRASTHLGARSLDIERALRFIRENATNGITGVDVMKDQGASRVTFEKYFTQKVGHSSAAEIRRVKLDHACRLLSKTDLRITEIAGQCGYSSSSQFCIIFRQAMKITPIAFRRKHGAS